MNEPELLPCPCCNSTVVCFFEDDRAFIGQSYGDRYPEPVASQNHGYKIRCEECGLQTCFWHIESEPVKAWNNRP